MMFKPGDYVECVDSERSFGKLEAGKIYQVVCLGGEDLLSLKDVDVRWARTRFKRAVVPEMTQVDRLDPPAPRAMAFKDDSATRKGQPVFSGVVRYFPAALSLVAMLSKKGNDKHNPGEEMHHARGKSNDHGDCILRHQMGVGTIDPDSDLDHAVGVAWRALAQLQELAEKRYGWPKAPGAK